MSGVRGARWTRRPDGTWRKTFLYRPFSGYAHVIIGRLLKDPDFARAMRNAATVEVPSCIYCRYFGGSLCPWHGGPDAGQLRAVARRVEREGG